MQWSEFIGGAVVISPPFSWRVRYNARDIPVLLRIDKPVDPKIVDELSRKFVDFRRAYTEDGLTLETFDSFGHCIRPRFAIHIHWSEFIGGDFVISQLYVWPQVC